LIQPSGSDENLSAEHSAFEVEYDAGFKAESEDDDSRPDLYHDSDATDTEVTSVECDQEVYAKGEALKVKRVTSKWCQPREMNTVMKNEKEPVVYSKWYQPWEMNTVMKNEMKLVVQSKWYQPWEMHTEGAGSTLKVVPIMGDEHCDEKREGAGSAIKLVPTMGNEYCNDKEKEPVVQSIIEPTHIIRI
jgi:hypothetical protein